MNEQPGYSPFPLIHLMLDNARLLLAVPLSVALFAVLFGLVAGGGYAAESSFRPQAEQSELSRFSGLASQLGIDLPVSTRGESIDFYARLATSRALLEQIAGHQYTLGNGRTASLVELYDKPGTGAEKMRRTVDHLARRVSVDKDLNSGIVGIRTRHADRVVAEQINRAILDEVNRFNLERRQSHASAERQFVEAQVSRAREELENAERTQTSFMQSNRRYEEWPQLRAEAARLQRQVDHQQQLFTALTQALQRARLDEVRNTPVITIIDHPEGSARRDRRLLLKGVLGALLGLTIVAAFLFGVEYTERLRKQYPEEFARVGRRRPWIAAVFCVLAAGCDGGPFAIPFDPVSYTEIQAGGAHSCGLASAGEALCWGRGVEGQLGQGAYGSSVWPVHVAGSHVFTSISLGLNHTCALDAGGAVWCWGWGHLGQLGNGTQATLATPTLVQHPARFTRVSAGHHHTCALDEHGAVWCWGDNSQGQLGDGTTTTVQAPVAVQTDVAFAELAAGGHHTCAVATSGRVYCWGLNVAGQLGTGDASARLLPAPLADPQPFVIATAGSSHSCALTAAGQAYCWGSTRHGELGFGHMPTPEMPDVPVSVPTPVHQAQSPAGTVFRTISAGRNFTCAVDSRGAAWCWGGGHDGQLGGNRLGQVSTPQPVRLPANTPFARLSAGYLTHACAVTDSQAGFCWGTAGEGGLGVRTATSTQPTRVPGPPR